jgi:hypothetical protein
MNREKSALRARAANLFAAEERSQELMGMALLQQQGGFRTLEAAASSSGSDKQSLDKLLSDSDEGILTIHQQLQNARGTAAQLQANDKQLNELNRLIYGGGERAVVDDIIEGEIIEEVRAAKVA